MFKDIMQTEVILPAYLSPEAQSLTQQLLCKDPAMRLGGNNRDAEEVKEHGFFRGLDWNLLYHRQLTPPFIPSLDSEYDTKYVESVMIRQDFTVIPAVDSSSNEPRFASSPTYQGFTYQGSPIKEGNIS